MKKPKITWYHSEEIACLAHENRPQIIVVVCRSNHHACTLVAIQRGFRYAECIYFNRIRCEKFEVQALFSYSILSQVSGQVLIRVIEPAIVERCNWVGFDSDRVYTITRIQEIWGVTYGTTILFIFTINWATKRQLVPNKFSEPESQLIGFCVLSNVSSLTRQDTVGLRDLVWRYPTKVDQWGWMM